MMDRDPIDCDICSANVNDIQQVDEQIVVLRRPYGLQIAPRRHVKRWRDLSAKEQHSLTKQIAPTQNIFGFGVSPEVVFVEDEGHMC